MGTAPACSDADMVVASLVAGEAAVSLDVAAEDVALGAVEEAIGIITDVGITPSTITESR